MKFLSVVESETEKESVPKLAYGSNFNLKNESESAVEALAIQFI